MLAKLVSMSVALECSSILECVAVWIMVRPCDIRAWIHDHACLWMISVYIWACLGAYRILLCSWARSCMCQNPVISLWTSLWACCKYQNPVIWFSWKNKACSWGYRIWYAHEHLIYVPKSCNILMSLVCLYMSILLHDFRVYMNVLMRIPDRFKIIFSFW